MTVARDVDGLVRLRRELHAFPELGFEEIVTAARVVSECRAAGASVRFGAEVCRVEGLAGLPPADRLQAATDRALAQGVDPALAAALSGGMTGVVASVRGALPGPVVAVRCDLDGLPVHEDESAEHVPARHGFASRRPGLMHACGHDGHTAIGIELVRKLAAAPTFAGELQVLFQPAEEGVRGAKALLAAGVCEDVDVLLGLHLGIGLPLGTVAACATGMMATVKLSATFTGRPAHAALAPHAGRNALLGAAAATLAIHGLPPVPGRTTRVNVGRLVAGTAANIVPALAELELELRADDQATCDELVRRAEVVLAGAAQMHELELRLVETGRATTATPDDPLVQSLRDAADAVAEIAECLPTATMTASDDATLLMRQVQSRGGQASYLLVGANSPAPHHHPRFDVDERALHIAVDWLESFVRGGARQPVGAL